MKNAIKQAIRKSFEYGQRVGLDLLPRHFYSEIPDIRRLRQAREWRRPYSMRGIAGSGSESQLEFVKRTVTQEVSERLSETSIHEAACRRNGVSGFGKIESEFLYAFISTWKPAQIIQVGAGVSTAVCLAAAEALNHPLRIICVDPYPTGFLRELADGRKIELIEKPVQALDVSFVDRLSRGDLLFIDSTHTLGPAGEVSWLILEVLPQVAPGVRVHFHDIVFPYDYSPHVLSRALFFPHESILLQAFLSFNSGWRILASLSALHHSCPASLQEIFEHYHPMRMDGGLSVGGGDFPSSVFLEAVAAGDAA